MKPCMYVAMDYTWKYIWFCAVLWMLFGSNASAQRMETYKSKEYNIQFDIPADWSVSTGIEHDGTPYLEAVNRTKTVDMYVYVYKDSHITPRELLTEALKNYDIHLNADGIQQETINGLEAYTAIGTGTFKGQRETVIIMAATFKANNIVTYVAANDEVFNRNRAQMNKIIDSFKPIK